MEKITGSTTSTKRKRSGDNPKFYAVREGRTPGIYHSWDDCLEQVKGHKGAVYKSFTSLTAAEAFVKSTAPLSSSSARKFYAVRRGHTPGIYTDWPSAQKQITGYNKPKFKSFSTRAEADSFIRAPSPSKSEPSEPPTKKRRSEGVTLPSEDTFNPYLKELPDDAEDSFDYSMKLDAETGQLRLKTKRELDALKVVPLPTSKAGETVKVWTDGACRANGQPGAAAGVGVWFGHQDPRNVSERLPGPRQTNQRAELLALKRALDVVPLPAHALVYSDSMYAIKCVTEWFQGWERRGWTTAGGKKPVENRDLVEDVLALIRCREQCGARTTFEWVKGHADNVGNVGADELAVRGAELPMPLPTGDHAKG